MAIKHEIVGSYLFLGAFGKLLEANIRLVRPSVRLEQHRTDFH